MDERIVQFRIGVMVLFVAIIAVIMLVMFGEVTDYFKPTYTLTIEFPEAPGVTVKSPVRKSGVLIGRVSEVKLLDNGNVRVTARIDATYKIFPNEVCEINRSLLNDSELEIVRHRGTPAACVPAMETAPPGHGAGLIAPSGGKQAAQPASGESDVQLAVFQTAAEGAQAGTAASPEQSPPPGLSEAPEQPLQKGGTLQGRVRPDPMNAVQSFEGLRDDLSDTAESVRTTSDTINQFFRRLNGLLGPETNAVEQRRRLAETLDNTNKAMQTIGALAKNANSMLGDEQVRQTFRDLPATMAELRSTMTNMNGTIARANQNLDNLKGFTQALGENGPSIVSQLDRSAAKLDTVMANMQVVGESLNGQKGTLGKLINDPSLYANLNDAARRIQDLTQQLEPILNDARVFSDKIARHPETLGVRGAIQPSQGTKGLPLLNR